MNGYCLIDSNGNFTQPNAFLNRDAVYAYAQRMLIEQPFKPKYFIVICQGNYEPITKITINDKHQIRRSTYNCNAPVTLRSFGRICMKANRKDRRFLSKVDPIILEDYGLQEEIDFLIRNKID